MPFFGGGNNIMHTTPIPAGVTQEKAIAVLFHDHEFFVKCNPHMIDFKAHPGTPATTSSSSESEENASSGPESAVVDALPEPVKGLRTGEPTKTFTVTDRVHTLPAGIWDSDIVSTYEFTNLKTGVFVRIKSPLSIVMDTMWEIKEGEGDNGEKVLVISEDLNMTCSMFLAPIVRSQVENGWKGIHAKMCDNLKT